MERIGLCVNLRRYLDQSAILETISLDPLQLESLITVEGYCVQLEVQNITVT